GNTTIRPRTFHSGKIHAKFPCDSARNRRRFHAGFFGLWWQPCRLRRRHACLYSFLFLFLLRLTFLLWLLFRLCFLFFLLLFGFWLFLFFLLRFFLFLWRLLAFATDERDLIADIHLAAFLNVNFGERPILG